MKQKLHKNESNKSIWKIFALIIRPRKPFVRTMQRLFYVMLKNITKSKKGKVK